MYGPWQPSLKSVTPCRTSASYKPLIWQLFSPLSLAKHQSGPLQTFTFRFLHSLLSKESDIPFPCDRENAKVRTTIFVCLQGLRWGEELKDKRPPKSDSSYRPTFTDYKQTHIHSLTVHTDPHSQSDGSYRPTFTDYGSYRPTFTVWWFIQTHIHSLTVHTDPHSQSDGSYRPTFTVWRFIQTHIHRLLSRISTSVYDNAPANVSGEKNSPRIFYTQVLCALIFKEQGVKLAVEWKCSKRFHQDALSFDVAPLLPWCLGRVPAARVCWAQR